MNAPGVLLDTGPLVALLSRNDMRHEAAKKLFSECEPPFRTCEAVLAEACFLVKKVHSAGAAEVIALGRKGVYEVRFSAYEHFNELQTILKKYSRQPMSLADACLVTCAKLFNEPRILTFDSDFRIYRWARNRQFEILGD